MVTGEKGKPTQRNVTVFLWEFPKRVWQPQHCCSAVLRPGLPTAYRNGSDKKEGRRNVGGIAMNTQ